ncbi:MAG TPA: hypothetical protein VFO85_08785 [Vicinamibacteria bacterium]|nr:hypothetical protein [Vicinamibacteria bacterium]
MTATRALGFKVLGVWLLISGLVQFVGALPGLGLLLGLLAVVAGLLILLGR